MIRLRTIPNGSQLLGELHLDDAHGTTRMEVLRSKEARMPEEDSILPLKNGAKAVARTALADCVGLRHLLRRNPRHFDVLLLLLRADGASIQSNDPKLNESIRFLKRGAYLEKDGTLKGRIRDVLESSYCVTPDGPVITQPFLLATDEDKALADRAERQLENWWASGMRRLDHDDDDPAPSR